MRRPGPLKCTVARGRTERTFACRASVGSFRPAGGIQWPAMSDAALLATAPRAGPRQRTIPTNEEIVAMSRDHALRVRRVKRYQVNRSNSLANVCDELRKLWFTQGPADDGWVTLTVPQIDSRLRDEHDRTRGARNSTIRWVRALADELRVIELDVATVGTGKIIGLRFRWRPRSEWWALGSTPHAPVAQLDRAAAF